MPQMQKPILGFAQTEQKERKTMIDTCMPNSMLSWRVDETAIPELDPVHLPIGIHDCSLEEISEVFGEGDHRADMARKFSDFVSKLQGYELAGWIMVDGSFVTSKELPTDIDVLVVVDRKNSVCYRNPAHWVYVLGLLNEEYARDNFGLHVWVGYADASTGTGFVNLTDWGHETFDTLTTVKHTIDERKGILRITL